MILDSCDDDDDDDDEDGDDGDDDDEVQTDAKGFLLMIFDVVHDSTDTISM